MKVIKPYFVIENPEELDEQRVLERLERYGRTCYKSEGKISEGSAAEFIRKIVDSGHESIIEHEKITVRVICDRGVTHEIVRHRIASYSQESTRYCNYSKDQFGNEITVIEPSFFDPEGEKREVDVPFGVNTQSSKFGFAGTWPYELNEFDVWFLAMLFDEWAYMTLIYVFDRKPQEARSVLPNSLKTEIVITYNLRQWRYFFRQRCSRRAHPQMREITVPLLRLFKQHMPVIFGDIPCEVGNG